MLAGPVNERSLITFGPAGADQTVGRLGLTTGTPLDGVISSDISNVFPHNGGDLNVKIGGSGPLTINLVAMNDLVSAGAALQAAIRAESANVAVAPADANAFASARVIAYTDGAEERLIVLSGEPTKVVGFSTTVRGYHCL